MNQASLLSLSIFYFTYGFCVLFWFFLCLCFALLCVLACFLFFRDFAKKEWKRKKEFLFFIVLGEFFFSSSLFSRHLSLSFFLPLSYTPPAFFFSSSISTADSRLLSHSLRSPQ